MVRARRVVGRCFLVPGKIFGGPVAGFSTCPLLTLPWHVCVARSGPVVSQLIPWHVRCLQRPHVVDSGRFFVPGHPLSWLAWRGPGGVSRWHCAEVSAWLRRCHTRTLFESSQQKILCPPRPLERVPRWAQNAVPTLRPTDAFKLAARLPGLCRGLRGLARCHLLFPVPPTSKSFPCNGPSNGN